MNDDVTAGNAATNSETGQGESSLVIAMIARQHGGPSAHSVKSLNPWTGRDGDQVCGSGQELKSAGYRASELGTFLTRYCQH